MAILKNNLSQNFSGPILFNYVWWILSQAKERGVHRLYFLARDGYLLREIAQLFCKHFHLPIECRYLYCSRASLRMPSYHLIGRESDELLLQGGYRVSIGSLLQRAELNEEQQRMVCTDCGLEDIDCNSLLSRLALEEVRVLLKNSALFHAYIQEKSIAAYEDTVGYLRQEGLLAQPEIVLVDSGWSGSMQRSLRQLLQSAGFSGSLTGFYFGMYAAPKEEADGTYLTWYFDKSGRTLDKILFCNNLFECLLSAPHGMTISYTNNNGIYAPVLLPNHEEQELQFIQEHIQTVLNYSIIRLQKIAFTDFDAAQLREDTRRRIYRYMAHPTNEEATYWSKFLFCDDITEAYHLTLASQHQLTALRGYSIPVRVLRRILKRPSKKPMPELFWPYGTITFLPRWKQPWYRWNVYIWEWIRYVLH